MPEKHRKPPGNRSRRIALVGLVLIAGLWLTLASLAITTVRLAPSSAYSLMPSDGRIAAAYALNLFRTSTDTAKSRPQTIAREALRHDGTAIKALTVLGLSAQLEGDQGKAARIFAHADRLSRRELEPRLASIEAAVGNGDIRNALYHYDIALRISADARGLLFPVLAKAITEPKVRSPLISVLRQDPNWGRDFLGYAATNGKELSTAVLLMEEGRRRGLSIPTPVRTALIKALVQKGQVDTAWRYYTKLGRGGDRNQSRDASFRTLDNPTPFDWMVGPDDAGYSTIARARRGGMIDFSYPAGRGGIAARQIVLFEPGLVRISGNAEGAFGAATRKPYWALSCAGSAELGRVPLTADSAGSNGFSGHIKISQSCPVQYLDLVVPPAETIDGTAGQVRRIVAEHVAR